MPKIFVFAPADRGGATHRMLESIGCQVVMGQASWMTPQGDNEAAMCQMAVDSDALIGTSIRSSPITQKIMLNSKSLRIVAKYTIGVDDVDVDAATELGILVTHAPVESNWGGVAEGTIAAMLCLLKRLRERDRHVQSGGWREEGLSGTYLGSRQDGYSGITLGIVGLGRIGGRVADLLRPWKFRILGYDPYVSPERFAAHGVEAVDLETLLRESDVVTLHVVLTKETRCMIGAQQLAQMKPSAVLVNTSRGGVVDEGALYHALEGGTIHAAALDVFAGEPLPQESPLRQLGDKVLLSPHMVSANSGGQAGGVGLGIQWATEAVVKALKGEVPDHVYNTQVISQWLERFGGRSLLGGS
jgi:D-3-phosphoglycerate dehydrogenase / 2-oxoglutarate reductase